MGNSDHGTTYTYTETRFGFIYMTYVTAVLASIKVSLPLRVRAAGLLDAFCDGVLAST